MYQFGVLVIFTVFNSFAVGQSLIVLSSKDLEITQPTHKGPLQQSLNKAGTALLSACQILKRWPEPHVFYWEYSGLTEAQPTIYVPPDFAIQKSDFAMIIHRLIARRNEPLSKVKFSFFSPLPTIATKQRSLLSQLIKEKMFEKLKVTMSDFTEPLFLMKTTTNEREHLRRFTESFNLTTPSELQTSFRKKTISSLTEQDLSGFARVALFKLVSTDNEQNSIAPNKSSLSDLAQCLGSATQDLSQGPEFLSLLHHGSLLNDASLMTLTIENSVVVFGKWGFGKNTQWALGLSASKDQRGLERSILEKKSL